MKNLLLKYWLYLVFGIFLIASIFNLFFQGAINFENQAAKEILLSKTALSELENITIPIVEDIPFLKSWGSSYQGDFDKILSYLNLSALLILIQMTLLKLSHWWIFKLILVVSFAGLFIKQTKEYAKKLIIIGLLISPGIAVYTIFLSNVTQELSLDMGKKLQSHFEATQDSLNTKKLSQQDKLDSLKTAQRSKHDGKLDLLNKVEDDIIKGEEEVKDELDKIGKDFLTLLRYASRHGLELAVSLFGNILIIFLILPLAYLYVIGLALKRLFGYPPALNEFDKIILQLKSLVPKSNSTK